MNSDKASLTTKKSNKMEYLYIGLTRFQQEAHNTCCGFYDNELSGTLKQNEILLSKYVFPLQLVVQQELSLICQYAAEIDKTGSFLELAQQSSYAGSRWAIELLKPPPFLKEAPGHFENDTFVPDVEFSTDRTREFCQYCMMADLSNEISSVIRLFFQTGRVLVEKAPKEKIIKYWEN